MDIDLLKKKEREAFLRMGKVSQEEAKKLLQEFGKACEDVEYEEDYAWLNEAIIKWETYLRAEFNEVYQTPIKNSKQGLKSRKQEVREKVKQIKNLIEEIEERL